VRSFNCKNQIGDQKLKEVPHSETLSAMCGRDARSVSEEKGNAAIYTQVLRSGTQPLGAGDDPASQGRQDNDFEAPPEIRSFWCNALIFEAQVAEMQLHWAVLILFLRGENS